MSLAEKWRQVQGQGYWEGMLDPQLDEDLCQELIRYSNQHITSIMVDTRNHSNNKWYGYPLYTKSQMFDKANVKNVGYTVSRYLYWSTRPLPGDSTTPLTTFCGYIAVSDEEKSRQLGRRDIVVAFRGTTFKTEWGANLTSIGQGGLENWNDSVIEPLSEVPLATLEPLQPGGPQRAASELEVQFGTGWLTLYTLTHPENGGFGTTSLRQRVISTLKELLESYKDEEVSITVTGHSLGAAMSVLCAYDIVNEKVNVTPNGKPVLVTAFSFASPRVGNRAFKKAAESMEDLRILRVSNTQDVVVRIPFTILGYSDTGVVLSLVTASSKYLKQNNIAQLHMPDPYCHLISGKVEFNKFFQLELVNRMTNLLLPLPDGTVVPPAWVFDINVTFDVDDRGHYKVTVKNITPDNPDYN